MTCIVGVVSNGRVTIGGDSCGSNGYDSIIVKEPKVFLNGDFLIGYTSSFRMGQLLRYSFTPPAHHPNVPVTLYMMTTWIDAVRKLFDTGGYSTRSNGQESGGTFLVGYQGRLFAVESDYQLSESADNFASVGSGSQYALGAMAMCDEAMPDRDKVSRALEIACRFAVGVRPPFTILETPAPT